MRHERQHDGQQPGAGRHAHRCPEASQQCPQADCRRYEHEQGMTETAMISEVGNGIAIIDEDIEVGQRTEQRTGQQRFAAMARGHTQRRHTGAKRGLRH